MVAEFRLGLYVWSLEFGEDELVEGDVLFGRLDGHGPVNIRGDTQGDVAAELFFPQGNRGLIPLVQQPFPHPRHGDAFTVSGY